ncbi:hypothetical protein EIP91_007629 [Steccherinum ochraceum]|uniref:Uncharacterized protein n=1 Tax=Steccherinum ochraceum TaxID=92696 RepID=A0A4R0R423_9APHY|nr:hypothetical protein EIP91_007629 [Steccherinum ochraceum]
MATRSASGHVLLPSTHSEERSFIPQIPSRKFLSWTFGRGSVIWRIWPAVLLHTTFAAIVVTISLKTRIKLGIPNVMLTLLGVVIGFVISYRASSGYDRYWTGRTAWSDVMRTSRTLGRLIWFHVPLELYPVDKTSKQDQTGEGEDPLAQNKAYARRVKKAMAEKRMALDLVAGYSTALKHHLRGETGIYYEDLYNLVKPLHDHAHHQPTEEPTPQSPEDASPAHNVSASDSTLISSDPVIPPINSYGTAEGGRVLRSRVASISSLDSRSSVSTSETRPLLPSSRRRRRGLFSGISADMIPFSDIVNGAVELAGRVKARLFNELKQSAPQGGGSQRWEGDAVKNDDHPSAMHVKHRPRIAGGGENIPLEVIRSLTIWLSVLERRGTVPGSTLGGMFAALAAFEDSLSEDFDNTITICILRPYQVRFSPAFMSSKLTMRPPLASLLRHTVWIYLFFLPFQLVDLFRWYTIPGVCIASFIYLGFVASGEEIEQPFGYDENDLDLDMFCREIIRTDIEYLKQTPCPNAYLGDYDTFVVDRMDQLAHAEHTRAGDVFGYTGRHLDKHIKSLNI